MVGTATFVAVLAFLPYSFSAFAPPPVYDWEAGPHRWNDRPPPPDGPHFDHDGRPPPPPPPSTPPSDDWWYAKPRARNARKRDLAARPQIRTGGLSVSVEERTPQSGQTHAKRFENGTNMRLATEKSTYIVPVTLGSVTYPLQLDFGSSDLLVASTLCGSHCPTSLGPTTNPYYDVSVHSSTFVPVNANTTLWNTSYADTTVASGFIAREHIKIAGAEVEGQVFGMINATNLTLSSQQTSGIMGLGFPRLSILARALLTEREDEVASLSSSTATSTSSSTSTNSASGSATSSSASAAAATPSTSYLPTFLESIMTIPEVPYPVIGLALTAPPSVSSTTTSSAASESSARFSAKFGTLTFGGVSGQFVSADSNSGRTIDDIEWHDVIPFGRASSTEDTDEDTTTTAASTSAVETSNNTARRKRQETSSAASASASAATATTATAAAAAVPTTVSELAGEEYVYWALELRNVSVNGSDIGLNSTYSSIGVPPIAMLDIGYNGISGPMSEVAKIFAKITDARQTSTGQWIAPCNTKMTLGFSFGGRYVQLQPSDWLYAQVASSTFCLAYPIGVQPGTDGVDWQLGTPFLRNVYSVYSYGINGVQAPLVGLLPLERDAVTKSAATSGASSATASSTASTSNYGAAPTSIAAFTATTTVSTNIPNALITTAAYVASSYGYVANSSLTTGALQTLGLANATAFKISQAPIYNTPNTSTATASQSSGATGDDQPQIGTTSQSSKAVPLLGLSGERGLLMWTVMVVVGVVGGLVIV